MIIDIAITDQIQSFIDSRHYNPLEIDYLALEPNTNGEPTYYVDGTNGSDSYDGLSATVDGGGVGPTETIQGAINKNKYRRGIRILIKSGTYTDDIDWNPWNPLPDTPGGLSGTIGEDYTTMIGPYGDGEVVINTANTWDRLGAFSVFNGTIYQSAFSTEISWAVMDYDHRSCRHAVGYTGADDRGTGNRATSMTDTSKDFGSTTDWDDGLRGGEVATNFVGAIIWNTTDGSWGTVTSISTTTNANDTLNFSGGLTGGTDNDFDNGDAYAVYIMGSDGEFAHVGSTFYINSTGGEPSTRNLIANEEDRYSSYAGIFITTFEYFKLYGLTIIGSSGTGAVFTENDNKVEIEKCRFMFCGRGALSIQSDTPINPISKNFVYATVMLNWPRGHTYWGGGGWPNGIGQTSTTVDSEIDGNIVWNCGGEGNGMCPNVTKNILVDNFSVGLYDGSIDSASWKTIAYNVVLNTGYVESDMKSPFYLQGYYGAVSRTFVKMNPMGLTLGEESANPNPIIYWKVYNNLVIGHWKGINFYVESPNTPVHDIQIVNNTIICMTGSTLTPTYPEIGAYPSKGISVVNNFIDAANIDVKNNLVIGANNPEDKHYLAEIIGTDYTNVDMDYNVYSFPSNNRFVQESNTYTFTQWKAATGYDANSSYTDTPGLVGTDWTDSSTIEKDDLRPTTGGTVIDAGADLSTVLTDDFDALSRPADAAFDVGAFEFGGAAYTPPGIINIADEGTIKNVADDKSVGGFQ